MPADSVLRDHTRSASASTARQRESSDLIGESVGPATLLPAAQSAGLEHEGEHDAARQALRGFLEKIVIPPGDGLLQIVGNLGEMLKAAGGRNASGCRLCWLRGGI